MSKTPNELFQDVVDQVLGRSAWGCLTPKEARELHGHLEALQDRDIGFSYFGPAKPINGNEMGMMVCFSKDQRKAGKIWFEKDTIQYTTEPHVTYSNWSAAHTIEAGASHVETIARDKDWVETVMHSMIEQTLEVYGHKAIWLTGDKPVAQPTL